MYLLVSVIHLRNEIIEPWGEKLIMFKLCICFLVDNLPAELLKFEQIIQEMRFCYNFE